MSWLKQRKLVFLLRFPQKNPTKSLGDGLKLGLQRWFNGSDYGQRQKFGSAKFCKTWNNNTPMGQTTPTPTRTLEIFMKSVKTRHVNIRRAERICVKWLNVRNRKSQKCFFIIPSGEAREAENVLNTSRCTESSNSSLKNSVLILYIYDRHSETIIITQREVLNMHRYLLWTQYVTSRVTNFPIMRLIKDYRVLSAAT